MIDLNRVPRRFFLPILERNLRHLGRRHKVEKHFLEAVMLRLRADAAWLWRSGTAARSVGAAELADIELSRAYAERHEGEVPHNVVLSRVEVHGRFTGVIGAARRLDFPVGRGRTLHRMAELLAADLERREDQRLDQVLDRIKEKVLAELRPKDLAYQILDGLHQLVGYDHSAALLIFDEEDGVFRVAAEKIVYAKAKSANIGHEINADAALVERFEGVSGPLVLSGSELEAAGVARRLLAYQSGSALPAISSLLYTPLFVDGELLGVLKMAAFERLPFDARDVAIVERFRSAAAVALRNVRVRESLERQALQAEMRAGLVVLARAVAHDVNNAIGSILPLAQQLRSEIREQSFDAETAVDDLSVIIDKADLCRRIFSNMLRVAGRRSRGGPVDVALVVEEMMPFLETQLANSDVELVVDVPKGLPAVRFSRDHLERVIWNLVTNAAEALGSGPGTISIRASDGGGKVALVVEDDGPGIPAELLDKVQEPFFTTKVSGTGLGLAICRSLAWQNDASMHIASTPGEGTRVEIELAEQLVEQLAEGAATRVVT